MPKLKKTTKRINKKFLGSSEKTHLVRRGETISEIAKKYKTTIYSILKSNDISRANLIFAGDVLIIKSSKKGKREYNKKVTREKKYVKKHRVRKGENISIIAKKYRIKVNTLLQLNKMRLSEVIFPGQVVIIRK